MDNVEKLRRAVRVENARTHKQGPKAGKNPCLKMRDKDHPYETWVNDFGWTWRVLKKWQVNDDKPYARWFCYVESPHADEYGDVYVKDIKANARKVGA